MAIVMRVQKWRPHLLGRKFKVSTDKKRLLILLEQRVVAEEYQRWVSKLSGYDFEIMDRLRSKNGDTDALSRRRGDYEFSELKVARISSDTSLLQPIRDNSKIVELRTRLLNKGDKLEGYGIKDGDVRYKGWLVLPRTSSLIPLIFCEMHGGATGGMKGFKRNIKGCLLQPLNLPEQIWEELSMDFIDGLSKSEGYSVIIVVVDRLNRVFISHFWKEMFKYQGTQLKRSTAYHPQIDRQTEVVLHGRDPSTIMGYDKGVVTTFEVDWKRRDVQFQVGDLVYLKLRPYRQVIMARKLCLKLTLRFYGPFEIVDRVGDVAYRLKLQPTAVIHPMFHVLQLKEVIGDHVAKPKLPVGLTEDMSVVCKPVEELLDMAYWIEIVFLHNVEQSILYGVSADVDAAYSLK
uniref:Uncharacterized protein n=1 Tax=Tanacetum cinerariifolium TaxID=118510 RepID=A0A699GNI9_TANCI|nr:hypothetical protein [Tanacetum cinerariifolium]